MHMLLGYTSVSDYRGRKLVILSIGGMDIRDEKNKVKG